MADYSCIAEQDYPEMPPEVRDCSWRRPSGTYGKICTHPRAKEAKYHMFEGRVEPTLMSIMLTCPIGYSLEVCG